MKNKKWAVRLMLLAVAVTAIVILGTGTVFADEIVASGTMSPSTIINEDTLVTDWTLTDTGILTLSGNGEMYVGRAYSGDNYSDYKDKFKKVIIENGITSIYDHAFEFCKNIESVDIQGDITRVGAYAFSNCENLKKINIPDTLKEFDQYSFLRCTSLEAINIPDGVTAIPHNCFAICESLKEFTLPESITDIDYQAFYGCNEITELELGENIQKVGSSSFADCGKLEKVTVWGKDTEFDGYPFPYDLKLKSIYVYRGSVVDKYLTEGGNELVRYIGEEEPAGGGSTDVSPAKTFKLAKKIYAYNGNVRHPKVTVKDADGKVIASDYYTVKYSKGCKDVGTYKVTIKMKEPYSGKKILTFKINPAKPTRVSVSAISKGFTIKWKKQTEQIDGFQVRWSLKASMKPNSESKHIRKTRTSYSYKKLKANTRYYVQIRTIKKANSITYYSDWTTKKRIKAKP